MNLIAKYNLLFFLFGIGCVEYSENIQKYKLIQVKDNLSTLFSVHLDSIEITKNGISYYASQTHSCYGTGDCSRVLGEPDADIYSDLENSYSIRSYYHSYGFVVVSFQDENGDDLQIESGDTIKVYFLNEYTYLNVRSILIRAVDFHGEAKTICSYRSPDICRLTAKPEIDFSPERIEICSQASPVICQVP